MRSRPGDRDSADGTESGRGPEGHAPGPCLRRASDVQTGAVAWLWDKRLPRGAIALLEGDPGLGKSLLACDLAARISTGTAFPDNTPCEPAGVVILSAEDSVECTIVPRLRAAHADLSQIAFLDGVPGADGGIDPLTLPEHSAALGQAILASGAALVIIDPLAAYQPDGMNSWNEHHVRRMLRPLAELAQETGATILGIRHWKKGGEANSKHKGGGSISYTAAARMVYAVAEEPDGEHVAFAEVKNNLAPRQPSLRYRIVDGPDALPLVEWCGPSAYRADDLADDRDLSSQLEEAVSFLQEHLSDGQAHAEQTIRAAMRREGISISTYKRARKRLNVKATKIGFGGAGPWYLTLPASDYEADERDGIAHG